MTAPGQTAAISVFTDPLIAELGISRNALSTSYLIGTLGGAGAMPLVGRALDRFGVGRTMTVIAAVFGAVLIGLSFVTGILGLTAGFIGIRIDRKSTRLNSSHVAISYAVFCLKQTITLHGALT